MTGLTFSLLRKVNAVRTRRWHKGGLWEWSLNDWLCAMGGEAGEALNAGKKHRRILSGLQQHGTVPQSLRDAENAIMEELADVVIYADLVASYLHRDLGLAVVNKFNAISKREGFPEILDVEVATGGAATITDALQRPAPTSGPAGFGE